MATASDRWSANTTLADPAPPAPSGASERWISNATLDSPYVPPPVGSSDRWVANATLGETVGSSGAVYWDGSSWQPVSAVYWDQITGTWVE